MAKETKDMIDKVINYSSEDKGETIKKILRYTNGAMAALVVGMALAMFDVMGKFSFIMIFSFYIALFFLMIIQIYSSGKQAEMEKKKSYMLKRIILLIGGLTILGVIIRILSGITIG
jgi:hypothetical protein